MIRVRGLTKRYPGRTVTANAVDGIDLDIAEGKLVTLLGPSGCGKTTTLRLIAGLERADGGVIEIAGEVVSDPARGVSVDTHRRPIGIVFQSYAIWPHMTVAQNVMFPLKVAKPRVKGTKAREMTLRALDMVGLADFADRPAPALSGGQQQRVALARALVREPQVLLLDEPLSNLDAGLRDRMRDEIRAVQQRLGITTVFVTHDQDEALAVSDEILLLNRGRVVERGLPREIYAWPRSEFTARFLGASNRLPGRVAALRGERGELVEVEVARGRLVCRAFPGIGPGDEVGVFLRPESLRMTRRRESPDAWEGTAAFSVYRGDCWDCHVSLRDRTLIVRVYGENPGLAQGDTVYLEPEEDSVIVLPADRTAVPSQGPAGAEGARVAGH